MNSGACQCKSSLLYRAPGWLYGGGRSSNVGFFSSSMVLKLDARRAYRSGMSPPRRINEAKGKSLEIYETKCNGLSKDLSSTLLIKSIYYSKFLSKKQQLNQSASSSLKSQDRLPILATRTRT